MSASQAEYDADKADYEERKAEHAAANRDALDLWIAYWKRNDLTQEERNQFNADYFAVCDAVKDEGAARDALFKPEWIRGHGTGFIQGERAARSQLAAIRAEREKLRMLGAIVLAAADADIGIARLSDDGLAWECPKCAAPGSCEPGCTRNALLIALDVLSEAIRPAPAAAERSGETPKSRHTAREDGESANG